MRIPVLLLALFAAPLSAQEPVPSRPSLPAIGKPAPAFRLNDHDGKAVAVGGATASWTVLAFYPKAATPG